MGLMAEKKIIKNQKKNFVDDWLKDLDFTGWLETRLRPAVWYTTKPFSFQQDGDLN